MKSHLLRPALRPVAGGLLSASLLCNAVHAAEAFSPNSKWMLGDWGGKRTELLEKGYDFNRDAPINLSCSRGKLQFSRHLQRHWTKSDRKIMYGELFRPVLRVKREPHPYP